MSKEAEPKPANPALVAAPAPAVLAPQIGDTVKLKSGGPAMTVAGLPVPGEEPDSVRCEWFVDGQPHSRHFSLKTLAPAE